MPRPRYTHGRVERAVAVAVSLAALAGCGDRASPGTADAPRPLTVLASLGEPGLAPGQLAYPRALDHDAENLLWVIDKAGRVQRIDPATGRAVEAFMVPEYKLGKPTGVTVFTPRGGSHAPSTGRLPASTSLLFIPETHYQRIRVLEIRPRPGTDPDLHEVGPAPEAIAVFGSFGQGPGQFIYPTDVAILPTPDGNAVDRIYVSEYGGNDRVSVFDASLNFLFAFGTFGDSADAAAVQFDRPQSLAIDTARSHLIVTDSCNHRLGVFQFDGSLIRWIGSPDTAGDGAGQFRYPYGLCLLADGSALVSEFGNHRVQHIDPDTGKCLGIYGRPGRAAGELNTPWAITVIDHTAYVLDTGNDRILAFRAPSRGVDVHAAVGPAAALARSPGGER